MSQLDQIKAQALSAIVTAVILALLMAVWQLATDGGLVSALGGATNSALESIVPVPSGAVVAFDLTNGCPEGWSAFTEGQSRMIVGAMFPNGSPPKDEGGQPSLFPPYWTEPHHTRLARTTPVMSPDPSTLALSQFHVVLICLPSYVVANRYSFEEKNDA